MNFVYTFQSLVIICPRLSIIQINTSQQSSEHKTAIIITLMIHTPKDVSAMTVAYWSNYHYMYYNYNNHYLRMNQIKTNTTFSLDEQETLFSFDIKISRLPLHIVEFSLVSLPLPNFICDKSLF